MFQAFSRTRQALSQKCQGFWQHSSSSVDDANVFTDPKQTGTSKAAADEGKKLMFSLCCKIMIQIDEDKPNNISKQVLKDLNNEGPAFINDFFPFYSLDSGSLK